MKQNLNELQLTKIEKSNLVYLIVSSEGITCWNSIKNQLSEKGGRGGGPPGET